MRAAKRPKRRSARVVTVKHRQPKPRPAKRSVIIHKRKRKMAIIPAKHEAPAAVAHADKPHEPTPVEAFLAELELCLKHSAPITQQIVDEAKKLLGGDHKK